MFEKFYSGIFPSHRSVTIFIGLVISKIKKAYKKMALKWHPDKIRNSATILNELLKELAKHTKFSPMQKRGHMICTEHVRERLGLAGRLDMIIEFLFIHYSPRELILHFSIIQNKEISRLAVVQQMESEV